MPKRRYYRRRVRRYRRRGRRIATKSYVNKAIAKHVIKAKHDTLKIVANQSPTVIQTVTLGESIAKGVDTGDRIGWDIKYKGLKMQWIIANQKDSKDKLAYLRLLLVRDKEPFSGTLYTKMFDNVDAAGIWNPQDYTTSGDPLQIWKQINRKRYTVIKDKKIKIAPKQSGEYTSWYKPIHMYWPLRANIKIPPDADPGAGANPNWISPNFRLIWFVQYADGSTPANPNIDVTLKLSEYYSP